MTTATELGQTKIVTQDGVVTATLVDRVSPERIVTMLVRGAAAARYANQEDQTALVDPSIRALLVEPKVEDG
jgi:hypothetical protein